MTEKEHTSESKEKTATDLSIVSIMEPRLETFAAYHAGTYHPTHDLPLRSTVPALVYQFTEVPYCLQCDYKHHVLERMCPTCHEKYHFQVKKCDKYGRSTQLMWCIGGHFANMFDTHKKICWHCSVNRLRRFEKDEF